MTFVTVLKSDTLAEVRMSYLPHQKLWFVTPGQEDAEQTSLGKMRIGEKATRCISCHTVFQPGQQLLPDAKFMGVGCESCHGPAGAHVAAEKAGKGSTAPMEHLSKLGGAQMNTLCGKCHRTLKEVVETNLDKANTQRFQPYGLALSRCFKESSDKLSCTTCHDVHSDVSTNLPVYEKACLRCHAPANARPTDALVTGKSCPINASHDCVHCHMPSHKVFQFSTLPVSMPDHYIRVHK